LSLPAPVHASILEFDQYISPDGKVYNFHDGRHKFLLDRSGDGLPPIEYRTKRGPFQHGETLTDYVLRPRVIQMLHRRQSTGRNALWDARADLLNLIRPNRQLANTLELGQLRKILPSGAIRDLDVLISEGPAFQPRQRTRWDEWAYEEALRFIAWDPTFYDPTAVEFTFALGALDHLIFPIEFPIRFGSSTLAEEEDVNYAGTWLSYPQIVVTGPLENLVITNTTTDKRLELTYDIPVGEVVTIETAYGEKSITNDDVPSVNLIGALTDDSDLANFYLAPDPEAPSGVNHFMIEGAGASPATVVALSYFTRYIGI
jgi:hypothetical protein